MMERVTVDILHECLIEKIVSYLSFKDAAKMSILSKTWLRLWLTHPNVEFKYPYSGKHYSGEILDPIMDRYRDRKIVIDKFELSYYNFSYHIIVKWLDIAVTNGAKYLFFKVHNFSLPIFTILAGKSLTELVVECCTLIPVSFSSGMTNCNSLRKLSLTDVNLDENMIQTLLNCCPLIVSFIVDQCWGSKKIELLNLHKIKSVYIKNRRELNQLVKIQAPTLEHLTYDGYILGKLDIVECENLKSLDISHVKISHGFLQNLISGSQSLKDLKIQFCGNIMEIDSSNLESLVYMGCKIPKLKIARESRQLKHLKIVLNCSGSLKAAWFCNLREFLSNSISCPEVSLDLSQCNEINLTDLQLHHGVAIPKVGVLNVICRWTDGECPTFLDALLWSCHPRRLNIISKSATFECFINRLIYMKNLSHFSEPWHSQLKGAQAYIFDDSRSQNRHRVELNKEELSITPDWKWKTVNYYILLDW
ncbi:hypothetical protein MTR67_019605 [Solanum verrucosum]|uniref:F-box family protein n=1 Tax=Solanum verrucosum TaxID=315347 RepID=A0AAF0QS51_SOLVR|nr:hypothetical protein MTR67_019605 [Solanum verrucosum]